MHPEMVRKLHPEVRKGFETGTKCIRVTSRTSYLANL
jgi:hypothetical protein